MMGLISQTESLAASNEGTWQPFGTHNPSQCLLESVSPYPCSSLHRHPSLFAAKNPRLLIIIALENTFSEMTE